ncbi:MAG: type IV pilus assembly protein PilM [Gemmatimonadota bacterium]|jgi:type IV pilus assembly protein PilM|nr:type IV pilus assembly protein PilM [Gemmatimonadota bacterium]MDQ8147279.1 type IV pilus assembly protein PilM [Gemmatimonadota bacterium]MDQ8149091.1 type IV pilus assembly protein PilM [Gemmatimonadota bacterium]MDQ8156297.1 type IV pilus assembly protein PilM [Gemmatimonadota bacterium]MDQ8170739.1 type IV pilus assembly protein PilM [Gemmatimonadota bacterium]
MALFGRKKRTIGLDVGSGLIKVVVVEHTPTGPELVRVALMPVLSDAIVEGEVMDGGIVADAITAALQAAGVTGPRVVAAVGGRDVIVKKIQIDRVKETQARELMRWEAEQHVPFDMESVELDFQILDPEGDADQMEVLLVAAKRDLVEAKMRLLADAGLTPAVIDVDAFALHNAFERAHPEAMMGTVALVNVGHDVTNINLVDDGVPVLTRDLLVGTRRFREDLQRDRGLGGDQAAAIIESAQRNDDLDAVLAIRGEEIAVGVERAAAFLASSSRSGAQIRSVYLTGGGARAAGLLDVLGARLGVPVLLANPLEGLTVRDGAFEALVTDEVAPLLLLSLGLAMRQHS